MNLFSKQNRIVGILTFLCVLLLSTTAMAAGPGDKISATTAVQSESVETDNPIKETIAAGDDQIKEEIGPGIKKKEKPEETEPSEPVYKKGTSLGIFSATGYCPCQSCSGKTSLTYSGTVPKPHHTISADITILPLGTKVMIDGVVYTVEDIGGSVKGNTVDIFFATHQEALNFGRQNKELFEVIEE